MSYQRTAEEDSTAMAGGNKKKSIVVEPEEVNNLFSLLDQLFRTRQKCQDVLEPLLLNNGLNSELVNFLEFRELTTSLVKRKTAVGIMQDDLQRFRLFDAAVKLVTKSTDERGQELSEQMDSLLSSIKQLMYRVLQKNHVLVPNPPSSENLEKDLNKTTREFLEIVKEDNKENAEMQVSCEMIFTEAIIEEDFTDNNEDPGFRTLCDVRNYVIVRDLRNLMLRFQRDLGNLTE